MITIVDYGNSDAVDLDLLLKNLGEESKVSNKEKDILSADKLIIPDSKEILQSIKKLHLFNLFSVLRMIRKPVLGIGTGMHLMTKSYRNKSTACLGCFPVECESISTLDNSTSVEFSINIIKETKLLQNVRGEDKFVFNTGCFIPVTELTTSTAEINRQISATIEKDNLFGIQFIPGRSGEAGLKVIRNFLAI